MKQGDLVSIYIPEREQPVDTTGVIVDIIGHKATVLCDGTIEHWDISDLVQMAKWKNFKKTRG